MSQRSGSSDLHAISEKFDFLRESIHPSSENANINSQFIVTTSKNEHSVLIVCIYMYIYILPTA